MSLSVFLSPPLDVIGSSHNHYLIDITNCLHLQLASNTTFVIRGAVLTLISGERKL